MTCFHASGIGHTHPLEEAAQLFELPTYFVMHSGQDWMISFDLSVLWGSETDCSLFIDTRFKAQMLTTCLFQIPTFTF